MLVYYALKAYYALITYYAINSVALAIIELPLSENKSVSQSAFHLGSRKFCSFKIYSNLLGLNFWLSYV